jgi:DNA-binding NtrC family response regulator
MAITPDQFVETCLAGRMKRLSAIVDATPREHPLYELYEAVQESDLALFDGADPLSPYRKLRRVLVGGGHDGQLLLIMIRYAVSLAARLRRFDEGSRLLDLAGRVNGDGISPPVRAAVLLAEASLHEARADFERSIRACTDALALGLEAPRMLWVQAKVKRASCAIWAHEFATAEVDVADLEARQDVHEILEIPLRALKAQLACEVGRPEEALAMLDSAEADDGGIGRKLYAPLCAQLLVAGGRLDEAAVVLDQAEHERGVVLGTTLQRLRATEALAHGDLDAARKFARAAVARIEDGLPVDLTLAMRVLASVELCAGRPAHARRILKKLDPDESAAATQMLWTRLYLLEGDERRAAEHFQHVWSVGGDYMAAACRHARELTAHALARLAARVAAGEPAPRPAATSARDGGADRPASVRLVGNSEAISRVRAQIRSFARLDAPVLISGETGTGKDVAARVLHARGPRAQEPFIPINCGALSETLVESELFGHVRGAFTGAAVDHDGLFVAAGSGVIFLDEIHAMSPRMQAALLRVLENGEVRPVGSSRFQRTAARVIAATNEPVDALVASGRLRRDLYYRLAKLQVNIPPLGRRPQDIEPLARHFLREIFGKLDLVLSEDLVQALERHPWPGNARQLRNEIERLVLAAGTNRVLRAEHLRDAQRASQTDTQRGPGPGGSPDGTMVSPRQTPLAKATPAPGGQVAGSRHTLGRRRRLLGLFESYERLTRADVIEHLGCSPNTATRDLRALEDEGLIRRVRTSAHLRTSYFVRNDG